MSNGALADLVVQISNASAGGTLFTVTGSFDTTGWTFRNFAGGTSAAAGSTGAFVVTGSYNYLNATANPSRSGNLIFPSINSGFTDVVGTPIAYANTGVEAVGVPLGYVSRAPIAGSIRFSTLDFSTITGSSVVYTWPDAGAGVQTLTFTAVPEPSSAILVGLIAMGVVFTRRRKR